MLAVGALMAVLVSGDLFSESSGEPEAAFDAHPERFERLRVMIGEEPTCRSISMNHFEWTDPCSTPPCPPSPEVLRPPGVSAGSCDWPNGCVRWVDQTPTPPVLAALCAMPLARAEEYLSLMKALGVMQLERDRPAAVGTDDVFLLVQVSGIITSGSERAVVWRSTPPSPSGGANKGSDYQALSRAGWFVKTTWN